MRVAVDCCGQQRIAPLASNVVIIHGAFLLLADRVVTGLFVELFM